MSSAILIKGQQHTFTIINSELVHIVGEVPPEIESQIESKGRFRVSKIEDGTVTIEAMGENDDKL